MSLQIAPMQTMHDSASWKSQVFRPAKTSSSLRPCTFMPAASTSITWTSRDDTWCLKHCVKIIVPKNWKHTLSLLLLSSWYHHSDDRHYHHYHHCHFSMVLCLNQNSNNNDDHQSQQSVSLPVGSQALRLKRTLAVGACKLSNLP